MKAFEYAVAKNERGVHTAINRGYKVKAGGIDLLDLMKERIESPDKLVSVLAVDSLGGVRETDDHIEVGALVTLEALTVDPLVAKIAPALADSVRQAATAQIRAVATVGGNICQRPRCWYFRSKEHHCLKKGGATCFAVEGDNTYHAMYGRGPCHIVHASNVATALRALEGEVAASNGTDERVIGADRFFVTPDRSMYAENTLDDDEVVTKIRIPKSIGRNAYVDLKEKQSFDWPLASAAVAEVDGKWNVVLGAVAPVPWYSKEATAVLRDAGEVNDSVAERVADAALKDAEPMSRNAWRLKLVRAAVRRAVLMADGKEID